MKIKTDTKKASEATKKREQRHKTFSKEDLIEAVKKAFKGTKGRIDPKYLWTDSGVHRFRVNNWSSVTIESSEFVHVIEENGKLTVRKKP